MLLYVVCCAVTSEGGGYSQLVCYCGSAEACFLTFSLKVFSCAVRGGVGGPSGSERLGGRFPCLSPWC